jgi:hypothetical protein
MYFARMGQVWAKRLGLRVRPDLGLGFLGPARSSAQPEQLPCTSQNPDPFRCLPNVPPHAKSQRVHRSRSCHVGTAATEQTLTPCTPA